MRVSLVCDPTLPRSERTFERQFKTECIQPGGGASEPTISARQQTTSSTGWVT